jgi:hypothetical protein
MRIRSIKPEFWRSGDITALDWESRLLFVGLWSYVDDNGVGIDKLASITADLFAGDLEVEAPETFARVSGGLRKLEEAGRISRYQVDGRRYLYITNWGKHQRIDHPNKARYPLPTSENAEGDEDGAEDSRHQRDGVATGTGEQGNRGTKKTSSNRGLDKKLIDSKFDEFWAAYPRREAKKGARQKFEVRVKEGIDPEVLIGGAKRYADHVAKKGRDREMIKIPTTWLNQGCWDDELDTVGSVVIPLGNPEEWLRRLWQDADVEPIERAARIRYERPNLPDDVNGKDEAAVFFRDHKRAWIAENKELILARVTQEQQEAAA